MILLIKWLSILIEKALLGRIKCVGFRMSCFKCYLLMYAQPNEFKNLCQALILEIKFRKNSKFKKKILLMTDSDSATLFTHMFNKWEKSFFLNMINSTCAMKCNIFKAYVLYVP